LALAIAHLELTDVVHVVAKFPGSLHGNLPVPTEVAEKTQPRGAQVHLHCLIDVRQRHAKGLDLVSIYFQEKLRSVWSKVGDNVVQSGLLGEVRRQGFGLLLQGFDSQAPAVFDDQLEAAGLAQARGSAPRR